MLAPDTEGTGSGYHKVCNVIIPVCAAVKFRIYSVDNW